MPVSQKADKVTHIKGRLMDQAVIFTIRPFLKWELLLKEEFAPRGSKFFPLSSGSELFPLNAVPFAMENNHYHIR